MGPGAITLVLFAGVNRWYECSGVDCAFIYAVIHVIYKILEEEMVCKEEKTILITL